MMSTVIMIIDYFSVFSLFIYFCNFGIRVCVYVRSVFVHACAIFAVYENIVYLLRYILDVYSDFFVFVRRHFVLLFFLPFHTHKMGEREKVTNY